MAKSIRVSDVAHLALKRWAVEAGCTVGSLVEGYALGLSCEIPPLTIHVSAPPQDTVPGADVQRPVGTGRLEPPMAALKAKAWSGPLSKASQVGKKAVLVWCLLGWASVVSAQTAQWVPGLELVVPISTTAEKDGRLGTPNAVLGYDRETGLTVVVEFGADCVAWWVWRPSAGAGPITHLVQVGVRTFVLYHASGLVRVERQPDQVWCPPPWTP